MDGGDGKRSTTGSSMGRDLLDLIDFELLTRCKCSRFLWHLCPCGANPYESLRGVVGAGAVGAPACRHSLPFLRAKWLRCVECGRESGWREWWV